MSTLYYEANPTPYVVNNQKKRGLIITAGGAGEFEFPLTGIVGRGEFPLCGTPDFVGALDEFASYQELSEVEDAEVTYINTGISITETVEISKRNMSPLRTLFISDIFGRDVSGGKTVYAVEVNTDCPEVIYLGLASRMKAREDIIFRGWNRILPDHNRARFIVSGLEFRVMLYTKGAGRFNIYSITAWMKLTDRRGFNTSPRGVKE